MLERIEAALATSGSGPGADATAVGATGTWGAGLASTTGMATRAITRTRATGHRRRSTRSFQMFLARFVTFAGVHGVTAAGATGAAPPESLTGSEVTADGPVGDAPSNRPWSTGSR